jgi:hypothetical protein
MNTMSARALLRSLPTLVLVALLAGLVCPAAGHAQKKKAPPPKGAVQKAHQEQMHLLKSAEARALVQAFALLAGANHDYDGHRAKAMGAVEAAVKALDGNAAKAVAAIRQAAKQAGVVHEKQADSDAQLQEAAQALGDVRGTFVKNKQPKVLGHVDAALKEIGIALKIR